MCEVVNEPQPKGWGFLLQRFFPPAGGEYSLAKIRITLAREI